MTLTPNRSDFKAIKTAQEAKLIVKSSPELILPTAQAAKAAGAALGLAIEAEDPASFLITLEGPLGVGKTTFCQGLAEALGTAPGEAVSPSFSLANVYQARRLIYHLDLYRLGPQAEEEFLGAGLEEYLDGLCLVEWPERLKEDFWPEERLELVFNQQKTRSLKARARDSAAYTLWLKTLEKLNKPE
ncbi:MAG: tRNA (adenosine(37)-N6)-threonylcarbamoyltransferase complex ATPase subunit type 1 TsaE [Deltaproteobacteria bacterium]|jgi:tRNA threonylcarbamoyladenosine biosynthesis protein TsaE|nr:tRNA (adenosine(37)-N6)-threonylcarbamoyltransferase complex ATPase subunit type 1 TsaE [Deltaproteobacteria bacterium]